MTDSSDVLVELLTLTVDADEHGSRWYYNSVHQLHRLWGPAVIRPSGARVWYQNDQLHRTTGPAIEYADGNKLWYLNDEYITEEEFHDRTK